MTTSDDIRSVMLKVIEDKQQETSLQSGFVLQETARRLSVIDKSKNLAILTVFNDLFRTGYLGWGIDFLNPSPPHFHITTSGRRALASLSRDPGNPDGYLRHLYSIAKINPVAESYLKEGLECFVQGLFKAAAVMVGAGTESLILEVRDCIVQKLDALNRSVTSKLKEWKLKTVLDATKNFFDGHKSSFQPSLRDEFEAYWMAFAQQIRAIRNDAGHPTSIEPVTEDTVHASLLIFPELAKLADKLRTWVLNDLK